MLTITVDPQVAPAGALLARRDGHTLILVDPALPPEERDALVKELLEE